ncbi:uncharacterized protein PRD47_011600 [Ara ararauna]
MRPPRGRPPPPPPPRAGHSPARAGGEKGRPRRPPQPSAEPRPPADHRRGRGGDRTRGAAAAPGRGDPRRGARCSATDRARNRRRSAPAADSGSESGSAAISAAFPPGNPRRCAGVPGRGGGDGTRCCPPDPGARCSARDVPRCPGLRFGAGPAAFITSDMTPPTKPVLLSEHTQDLHPWLQGHHYQTPCTCISLTKSCMHPACMATCTQMSPTDPQEVPRAVTSDMRPIKATAGPCIMYGSRGPAMWPKEPCRGKSAVSQAAVSSACSVKEDQLLTGT